MVVCDFSLTTILFYIFLTTLDYMYLVSLYNLFSFLSDSSALLYDIYCYIKESIISSHDVRKKRYGALLNGRLNKSRRKDMVVISRCGSGIPRHESSMVVKPRRVRPDPSDLNLATMLDLSALDLANYARPNVCESSSHTRPKILKYGKHV